MKQYKIRVKLKTPNTTIETIVNASSSYDVKKIVEGQYGSNLQSYGIPQEVK